MLSQALSSLEEAKLQLQRQLAQRAEYRALLIIDKATRELAEILNPSAPSVAAPVESIAEEAPPGAPLAAATPETTADVEPREDRLVDAPVAPAVATDEPSASPSPLARPEIHDDEAPLPAQAPAAAPLKAVSRAIDLFLSSTAPAVPVAAPPPRRSYLPFVAAPRLVKSAGAN
jgi:hypothetical protein